MKCAHEILLIYTFLATAVTLTVSQNPKNGMQVPNDQNAFITPTPTFENQNSNESDSNLGDLESMAAQIAEFTDRSFKNRDDISIKNSKEQKTKYAQQILGANDKNNSSSSLTGILNSENESQKISHKKKDLSEQENQFKKDEVAENDSLEASPSELVRTSDRTQNWQQSSPPQDFKTKKSSDAKDRSFASSNETKEETRLLGVWKLPPDFIGFQILDGESANVAKPAAIVESRSFITNPEISSVRLNFVVPQGKVPQESNKKSSVLKNKQRRQHSNDESYSSAEHSGEGPASDVYTETDSDLGKFLDEDYKARIEKEAEALIKKNKQENKGGGDSSENDKQRPHSNKHQKTAYSNNHSPSSPFTQNDNIYHGNSIQHKPYSQQEYVHHDMNKPPQIHSQRGNVHNEANKSPQTFSKQKITFPGGTVFFYKGMDGMLYDPALFPGLFESTKIRNSPNINGGYSQNSPPSSEIYISPDYETHPLYLGDGYPIEYSNAEHYPSSNFERQPKLVLVQPITEKQIINEKRPQNLRPFSVPGNHPYVQPHNSENQRQPPPIYKKHYREAMKVSDEKYQKQLPTNYEPRERDLPVRDEYRKHQPNGGHSIIPYHQKTHISEQEQHRFNSESSEEDCSPEEKNLDQTSYLDEDHLPVAPVPQAKLNINNPIPINAPLASNRPHKNVNLQSFNRNPENQNRYFPRQLITEQKNINHPVLKSGHPYLRLGPDSEEHINPSITASNHPYSLQGPSSEEHINPPITTSNHPYSPQGPSSEEHINPPITASNHPYSPQGPSSEEHINPPITTSNHPYSPQGPSSEEHINPPITTSNYPYSPQGPSSEEHINPPITISNHPYSPQGPSSEEHINPPITTSNHPYSPQGPSSEEHINPLITTSNHPYSSQGPSSEEEYMNPPVIPSNPPAYSLEQHIEPVKPYIEEKENPETFQYERKHKYQVSMYEHDESIYQSKAPKGIPYEPEIKTSSEEFVPKHSLHSAEEPHITPQDQSPNLITPQDKTRHIQFESGFHPMSAPAVYGPKPNCHGAMDSDISQSDPHINSMPSPHHQEVGHFGAGRSLPSETYQDSPQAGTNINDMEGHNQNDKHFGTEDSADEEFHPHTSSQKNPNTHQQYQDKSLDMSGPTDQTSPPPSSYSNPNEDKEPEHRHQPKLRVVTAPIPNIKQNEYPNADRYGEEHFKQHLTQRPEISSRYQESSEPKNEVPIERKKSKKRSSKNSKGRRNKRNGKKANKNVKKSRKHRSTRENMMAAAATYHWGMENHKDKDGFFLYANVPQDDAYEYGYRMGGPEQLVEKHHRTEGDRSRIKLNWEDKNGDSGDQYWEFNHSSSEGEDEKPKKRTQKNTKS